MEPDTFQFSQLTKQVRLECPETDKREFFLRAIADYPGVCQILFETVTIWNDKSFPLI